MNNLVVSFLWIVVASLVIVYNVRKDDMTVCELSHSHDVCFQALNR